MHHRLAALICRHEQNVNQLHSSSAPQAPACSSHPAPMASMAGSSKLDQRELDQMVDPPSVPRSIAVGLGMQPALIPLWHTTTDGSAHALQRRNSTELVGTVPMLVPRAPTNARGFFSHARASSAGKSISTQPDEGVDPYSFDNGKPELVSAVDVFNGRHRHLSGDARGLLSKFGHESPRSGAPFATFEASLCFEASVIALRRNRLFTVQPTPPAEATRPWSGRMRNLSHGRRNSKWSLAESIWVPRKTHGNSRDYYETDMALSALFSLDWRVARSSHGLSKRIVTLDETGTS